MQFLWLLWVIVNRNIFKDSVLRFEFLWWLSSFYGKIWIFWAMLSFTSSKLLSMKYVFWKAINQLHFLNKLKFCKLYLVLLAPKVVQRFANQSTPNPLRVAMLYLPLIKWILSFQKLNENRSKEQCSVDNEVTWGANAQ